MPPYLMKPLLSDADVYGRGKPLLWGDPHFDACPAATPAHSKAYAIDEV
jgi:hypothetical protein